MSIPPVLQYVLRRLLMSVVVLAGISMVSFTTVYLLPSDPLTSRYPMISEADRAEIRTRMGFDQPLHIQYVNYMEALCQGDLGWSYNSGRPVLEDMVVRLPASLELAFYALLLGLALAIPLGIIAAVYRNGLVDHLARLISIGSLSMPVFWIALVGIYVFFYVLNWAPAPLGRLPLRIDPPMTYTGLLTIDTFLARDWRAFAAAWRALALPTVVVSLTMVAPISRITRAAVSEALQEEYVTFARAVGIPERDVVMTDALRGSLVTIMSMMGYVIGTMIGGDALVEKVFSWPGIGRYAIDAVVTSDMAAINAVFLFVAVGVALTNLLVDLSYAVIDPRIRHGLMG